MAMRITDKGRVVRTDGACKVEVEYSVLGEMASKSGELTIDGVTQICLPGSLAYHEGGTEFYVLSTDGTTWNPWEVN